MAITEILVHVDATLAAEIRVKAAVGVAVAAQAHVSALYLVAEPFMRAMVGKHLAEELVRQQLAALDVEADERLSVLAALAQEQGVELIVDAHRAPARLGETPGLGLTAYLTRHGAKARVKQVAASGGIADTILTQVGEIQAELLVMGGYGHLRMRELMFGGVTRSIPESAACPILVSH